MGGEGNPESDTEGEVLDALFWLLANQRRRLVLSALQSQDGSASLSTLTEQLAEWEGTDDLGSIQVTLVHQHLPRMAETGAITFDSDAQKVALTEKGEHILTYRRAGADSIRQLWR